MGANRKSFTATERRHTWYADKMACQQIPTKRMALATQSVGVALTVFCMVVRLMPHALW